MIARVARNHFRRFGYVKTSMNEIAQSCGMSVANLYRYFDGKLAIGTAVAEFERSTLLEACDRAVARAGDDVFEKLIALFRTSIDVVGQQLKSAPLLFELELAVTREQPERRQRLLRETESRITRILASSTSEDAAAIRRLKPASRLILTACASFVLPWMLQNRPFGNPRNQLEPLLKVLVAGLRSANSPALPEPVDSNRAV